MAQCHPRLSSETPEKRNLAPLARASAEWLELDLQAHYNVAQFPVFRPRARRCCHVNVLARRGHCHQPRQHHPLRPTRLIYRSLVRSPLLSNTGRAGSDASLRSLGNGAPIFFGTFPSPRGLLRAVVFIKPGRNFRPGAPPFGFSLRARQTSRFLATLPIELQAQTYLWFTCALCKNHNRYRSPAASRPPKRFQFTFLQCRKPTWHVLHFGQACWRPLGGLVSLRLKRGPDVELGFGLDRRGRGLVHRRLLDRRQLVTFRGEWDFESKVSSSIVAHRPQPYADGR